MFKVFLMCLLLVELSYGSSVSKCDLLAASPIDPLRKSKGVEFEDLNIYQASNECEKSLKEEPTNARYMFQLARGYFVDNEYSKAYDLLIKSSEKGYSAAMIGLSYMYEHGRGVKKDKNQKFNWAVKAANLNNTASYNEVGRCYYFGWGVKQDYKKAAIWFKKADEEDNSSPAQWTLSHMYLDGKGLERDYTKAFNLLVKHKKNKDTSYVNNALAYMYENGFGVEKNSDKALSLYKQACTQGSEEACTKLYKKDIFLKLNSENHTGVLRDIIVTADKKHFITDADDKNIFEWDIEKEKISRRVIGQIGHGLVGTPYAATLSENNKYLVTSGYFSTSNIRKWGIRVYDFKSGDLLKTIEAHDNTIHSLRFSSDGKYLISGSSDNTVKVWDTSDFSEVRTFGNFGEDVQDAIMLKKGDDYSIIVLSQNATIRLFSFRNNKMLKEVSNITNTTNFIGSLAYSDEHIAVPYRDKNLIYIYDHSLNLVQRISITNQPACVGYSPSGKYLAVGQGTRNADSYIFDAKNSYKQVSVFKKHDNFTSVTFIDEDRVISAGGDDNDIYMGN